MEIVFFDIETTIPPNDIIEFGAIVLDKSGLYEKESYSTMIYSDKITEWSIECNGITHEMIKNAPNFNDVSDNIYKCLNGRIWAGHNINTFDIPRIKEAFTRIDKPSPEPAGVIDTLPLLRNTFGTRAGNMKMASLGNYFSLGQERHRAIEDSKMTLEVLKNCALIMFLEEHTGYAIETIEDSELLKSGEEVVYTKEVIKLLDSYIASNSDIWISYNGGTNPLIPRKIKPGKWIHYPWMLEAYCFQSQTNKNFSQSKIVEIRNAEWIIERKFTHDDE